MTDVIAKRLSFHDHTAAPAPGSGEMSETIQAVEELRRCVVGEGRRGVDFELGGAAVLLQITARPVEAACLRPFARIYAGHNLTCRQTRATMR